MSDPAKINLPKPQADTSWERIQMSLRMRFNPIRDLTPQKLSEYLDNFRLGWFRMPTLTWDAMERRDSRIQTVASKRKKAVARYGWEILITEDSPAALEQKARLEYFYNTLEATTALEPDEQGGMSLLIRQMMDAIGKRYAVHEITWRPDPAGLSAKFTFCPLWWFEGTRGQLRYLSNEFSIYGADLQPWGWMVTVGDGIMEACSVAYMFKHLPLKDWVSFSEKFGFPGLLGETDAAIDSPEWMAMENALKSFSNDWAAVTRSGKISLVEAKSSGEAPFKPLVEMMDEEITRLWRGSDLGTSSKAHAIGANMQGDESDVLEEDDATFIGETLAKKVSKFVLAYYFGEAAPSLAYIKIKRGDKKDVANEILVDEFLVGSGAPIAVRDALERYGRPQPEADEPLLQRIPGAAPAAPAPQDGTEAADDENSEATPDDEQTELANDVADPKLIAASRHELVKALHTDMAPVMDRLNAILKINDGAVMEAKLRAFLADMDSLQTDLLHDPATAQILQRIIAAGLANGLAASKTKPA